MASQTYKTRALVLKKTKLGDKDLIVTFLDESGALMQGVAKSARKPGGSFAARLELFSTVDVLMAKGRSLDVVCEVRLVRGVSAAGITLEQSVCASPLAELLGIVAQPVLEQKRLFDMSRAAFDAIAEHAGEEGQLLAVLAASLWKVMAQSGYRPSMTTCALCASPLDLDSVAGAVAFSALEGGLSCASCTRPGDAMLIDAQVARWCEVLIRSRYDEVLAYNVDMSTSFEQLHLVQLWIRTHTGRTLKSLDFLFTTGLF